MHKLFLLAFLPISSYCYCQSASDSTGSKISIADAQQLLDHHNAARSQVGTTPLVWSKEVAAYAQQWADFLAKTNDFRHRERSEENGKRYGENIFKGSSGYTPLDASRDWYDEKKNYKYGKFTMDAADLAGHYTQMVWGDTKQIGVGVAVCADGSLVVVADYFPEGNLIGGTPY